MSETERRIAVRCSSLTPGQSAAHFQFLGVFEAEVQLLLQRVGILVAAHGNVAGKQRSPAAHDIDIHHAGADVQQSDDLRRVRFVIHLEAVLQGEGVNIHHHWRLAGLRQHVGVVQNFVFLDGDQQNVHLILGGLKQAGG